MNPRPPLLLCHGWGFDASVWEPLRAQLGDWPVHAMDAGYFGAACQPGLPDAYVAVGHSLGAMRCMAERDPRCRGWVLINGFTRFSAAEDWPQGTPLRVLDRMIARLRADPAAVVAEFRRRCGAETAVPHAQLDSDALAGGLLRLRDGDVRQAWAARTVAALVLAGEADALVGPALSHASFGEDIQWCGGGHLLPLTHAEWCAGQIRRFTDGLAAGKT
ncbi:Pimeloyl-[acyl-carrier protein] methyl ester esterase [Pigmentiphaga humi]|uniref:Pimeloyl-[acyl-carrier protein] methyl ester esterase n=1 Tax=Pigmentiphaga humi TaxID=2478468 RepID=A0A3P4B812_9BURK|nr:alpha/beta hydrolase [Pigmentiphaga humi]VCU72457.1 Pimeloyl-[acyl-carrier protein] methyl ester esterase [Pigmentiphaga humi]